MKEALGKPASSVSCHSAPLIRQGTEGSTLVRCPTRPQSLKQSVAPSGDGQASQGQGPCPKGVERNGPFPTGVPLNEIGSCLHARILFNTYYNLDHGICQNNSYEKGAQLRADRFAVPTHRRHTDRAAGTWDGASLPCHWHCIASRCNRCTGACAPVALFDYETSAMPSQSNPALDRT